MIVVNEFEDQCMIYAAPDRNNEKSKIVVGADLNVIGGKKHTFHRQRQKFHFRETMDLANLETGLDQALQLTKSWALEIHQDHGEK